VPLPHEVGEHRALVARHPVKRGERLLELPRGLAAEVALRLAVAFVHAAPRGAQQEVGDVTHVESLPIGDLRGRLVLLGARNRTARHLRCQLIPHMLAQHRRDVRLVGEVALRARIAAAVAHVNEERQRLCAGGALVEVRALPAK